jgi:translocation and assembly module TamA
MRIALNPALFLISAFFPVLFSVSAYAQNNTGLPNVVWVIDGDTIQPSAGHLRNHPDEPESALLVFLGDAGYFSAVIDSTRRRPEGETIKIYATRGCRYTIDQVGYSIVNTDETGAVAQSRIALHAVDGLPAILRQGEPFSAGRVDEERVNLAGFFVDMGYLLTSVSLQEPEFPGDCVVNLQFTIDTGNPVVISGQLFPTIKRNNPEYLIMVTALPDSAVANRQTLGRVRRNLQQTGLFESVEEPGLMVRGGKHYLVHEIRERRTNIFDLLLGYIPDASGNGTLVGTGTLRLRNAITDGSMLFLGFERMSPMVTRFRGEFQQRWMFGMPLSAGGSFRFVQQDSVYQLRNFRLEGGYFLGGGIEVFGSLRREATSSNKGATAAAVRTLDGSAWFGGIGVRADTRDNILVPTNGLEFHLELETGKKRITDDRATLFTQRLNYRQQELSGYLRPYYSPFRRQVMAPSLTGFLKLSPEFTESDLYRTGGAMSIRGYREDQFLVSRLVWGDLEYRYLIDRTSYAFVFYALGWYEIPGLLTQPDVNGGKSGRIQSGGIGISYRTPVGQLRFTYAISTEDAISNGKVHFGLIADL